MNSTSIIPASARRTQPAKRARRIHRIATIAMIPALLLLPSAAFSQWIGTGAGGDGSDFNTASNWTSNTINGNFSQNTSNATITLSSDATLAGGLSFDWATANNLTLSGNGTLQLNGDVTLSRAAGESTVTIGSGITLDFGTVTTTRNVNQGTGTGKTTLVIDGKITGTSTLNPAISFNVYGGAGAIYLNNDANDFTFIPQFAATAFYTSVANIGQASALGAGTEIRLNGGDALNYIGSTDTTTNRAIYLSWTSKLVNASTTPTTQTFTGEVKLNTRILTLIANTGNTIDISGRIIGTGGNTTSVSLGGGNTAERGHIKLSNTANTYTQTTSINGGTVEVSKLADGGANSSIGASTNDATNLKIRGDLYATLKYTGTGDATDRLFTLWGTNGVIAADGTGALSFINTGSIVFGNTSGIRLVLDGSNTGANTFTPTLANNNGNASGIAKNGTGTWIIAGTQTYTGLTDVTNGRLIANAALAGTGRVAANAILGGTGTLAGLTTLSAATAHLAPGSIDATTGESTIGALALHGGLTATGGATLDYQINGASSDQIDFGSGSVTLGGDITVNITTTPGGSIEAGHIYKLFTAAGDSGGTWSGIPTSITVNIMGSGLVLDAAYGTNGYLWDTVNHELSIRFVTPVPEPAAVALFAGLFLLLLTTVRNGLGKKLKFKI
ncbi:MAG: hypothetical protein LBK99_24140 [Opitutaceae bacterium]|jgi:fibronectin-binding autotransporter adhesin|nr:hypothetical protein [Opitutaceae bacterium]